MTKTVLLLFLIGHVLGDFYLQTTGLAENKDKSFRNVLLHSGIYCISMTAVIVPIFSLRLLAFTFVISTSHFIIDLFKFLIKRKDLIDEKNDAFVYSLDQILHLFTVFGTTLAVNLWSVPIKYISGVETIVSRAKIGATDALSWILILLIIIQPVSVTIKKVLYRFRLETADNEPGIPNAGALIGVFERCIILLLLVVGQYSAIGFVLTAKSVARYNKMTENRKFSEYYLLGTLLSTLMVIAAYLLIFHI